ncbi:LOW QUALITY PROTEIN: hypothetical protein YC2023_046507 [Brassica napus]
MFKTFPSFFRDFSKQQPMGEEEDAEFSTSLVRKQIKSQTEWFGVVKRGSDVGRVRSVEVMARECVVVARDRVVMVRNRVVKNIPKEIEDVGSEVDLLLFPWIPVSDEEPFK